MVQTIAISENISLKYLKEQFDLDRAANNNFFSEWKSKQKSRIQKAKGKIMINNEKNC